MTSALSIADSTKADFPQLVNLILQSQSMSDEERQYWLSMLPVMTDKQRESLESILVTEQQKLAAIDAKYGSEPVSLTTTAPRPEQTETMKKIRHQEAKAQQADDELAADILEEIQDL